MSTVIDEIRELRQQRNAVILAHYYQDAAIQDVADFVGDSLELSRKAADTEADVIAFCGVHFMAETAKILNPGKMVVIPDMEAGCSLASGCLPNDFAAFRSKYPDHYVVSYINCSAAVKAQSDLICTSSNAVSLVNQLPKDRPVIFAPDKNLGRWVSRQTGRDMVLWDGSCQVHDSFCEESLMELWMEHKDEGCEVIAHPECEESLLNLADFVGSTSKLLQRVQESPCNTFIVATEPGIIHKMRQVAPDKVFLEVPGKGGCQCNQCPYMRLNSLEKLRDCLRDLSPAITLDEQIRLRAKKALDLMLSLS